MNKYYQTLDKILQTGKIQTNRKGRIKYLLNERLMLTDDYALVKAARDTIISEITTGREEGIKSDWSFHQHGPQM